MSHDVAFEEDEISVGEELIKALDPNFEKFVTRLKKYTPKRGDIFGVSVEPDTPSEIIKALVKNLEIFSSQTKIHFVVIPNNMDISDITDKIKNKLAED